MLENVSINIPFQKDSESRLNNLLNLISFLKENFPKVKIKVCEMDKERKLFIEDIQYFFLKQQDFFNKAECFNLMTLRTNESYIINHNVDFIALPESYVKAIGNLKNHDVSYLHNKEIYEVENIKALSLLNLRCSDYYSGAIAYNKLYIHKYKENIKIKCHGYDSEERFERFKILSTKVSYVDSPGFHVKHQITRNSSKQNSYYPSNQKEYIRIKDLSKEELSVYLKNIVVRQS
jgi:hypothetical protein